MAPDAHPARSTPCPSRGRASRSTIATATGAHFWDCSPADIADAVSDLATDVLWASLPQPVRDALEQVWSFIKGCARFVGDTLGSIQEVFTQFGQVMVDPQAFVRDKLQVAQAMYDGIHADSAGFAKEFFGGMVDAELFKADKAQWAGKIGCELAVGILTGGATASGRFANLLGDVNKFADRVRDWIRRGDKDGDGDVDVCTASFPSGTEVLLADGSRRRIEAIRSGDTVLAFDAVNGAWAGRPVLRQWSYLDTDEMATLRLTDGSAVSATDHHRFWSASRGAFEELEALTPGERLQTPQGPVFVDAVSLWPAAPTLVWELSVAVDHTFAVFAGDSAVAVTTAATPIPRTPTSSHAGSPRKGSRARPRTSKAPGPATRATFPRTSGSTSTSPSATAWATAASSRRKFSTTRT